MCLIFFSVHQHPKYKLILAGNRDEFYARKTAQADFWNNHTEIVGGCDLEAIRADGTCGTWMAMSRKGRLAFVTNYRDPKNINPHAPSRGHLVTDFLLNTQEPKMYMQSVSGKASYYNGFNLVLGNTDELFYFSNYQNEIQKLTPDLYGLSNHLLNTPWPKVSKGKFLIHQEIQQVDISTKNLFDILQDEERAATDQLPDTGIGVEREQALSSMFIKTSGYGTQCSTVILIDRKNQVTFEERTYNLSDFSFTTRTFQFSIDR